MFSKQSTKRVSAKSTVLVMAFILTLSTVTVAQAGWTSASLGTQIGNADDSQSEVQQKKCKKKKKKKCKKPSPSPSPTSSASPTGRVLEFVYTCPCTGHLQFGNTIPVLPNFGGGVFPLQPGEIYLSGVIADDSGSSVAVSIQQANETGGNMAVPGGRFCGETAEPVLLTEGREVRIWVGNFHGASSAPPGVAPCPALALGGTITFTLSATP